MKLNITTMIPLEFTFWYKVTFSLWSGWTPAHLLTHFPRELTEKIRKKEKKKRKIHGPRKRQLNTWAKKTPKTHSPLLQADLCPDNLWAMLALELPSFCNAFSNFIPRHGYYGTEKLICFVSVTLDMSLSELLPSPEQMTQKILLLQTSLKTESGFSIGSKFWIVCLNTLII